MLKNWSREITVEGGATLADAAVKMAYQRAINGNLDALKEIREAIEGKVGNAMVSVSLSLSEFLAATENTGEVPTWLEGEVIDLPAPELEPKT